MSLIYLVIIYEMNYFFKISELFRNAFESYCRLKIVFGIFSELLHCRHYILVFITINSYIIMDSLRQ